MKQNILWRLKSNRTTIVKPIYNDDGKIIMVQVVWSKSWEYGLNDAFMYAYVESNLEPLSNIEIETTVANRRVNGVTSI